MQMGAHILASTIGSARRLSIGARIYAFSVRQFNCRANRPVGAEQCVPPPAKWCWIDSADCEVSLFPPTIRLLLSNSPSPQLPQPLPSAPNFGHHLLNSPIDLARNRAALRRHGGVKRTTVVTVTSITSWRWDSRACRQNQLGTPSFVTVADLAHHKNNQPLAIIRDGGWRRNEGYDHCFTVYFAFILVFAIYH